MTSKKLHGIIVVFVVLICVACKKQINQNNVSEVAPLELLKPIDNLPLSMPLSISFTDSLEIATGDVFSYRKKNSNEEWKLSPADSTGTHSIAWKVDAEGRSVYYAVGTNKNQLLRFNSISGKPQVIGQETIPELFRPHDILYNPSDEYFYFINADYTSLNKFLFRFKSFEAGFEKLDLSPIFHNKEHSYARALSLVDRKIYIVVSSYGEVIQLDDFSQKKFTYYSNDSSREACCAGAYTKTGLVLNDVDYYRGYWYATNYFSSLYAGDSNYNEYRFIRWKNWDDFTNNRFQDLSYLIDQNMTPYYMTINDSVLYLTAFPDEGAGAKQVGKIYRFFRSK